MSIWVDTFKQCFLIPKPTLTEDNLPDQNGRVFIVTGGYGGVGEALTEILYQNNGTVYVAGRSKDKADRAFKDIKAAHPSSDGRLEFLKLDLADLASVKASAGEFMEREQRLDVLTNNAGVASTPIDSKTPQGHEVQIGTNCLGPMLFSILLTPLLQKTAASSPPGSVRATWAASLGTMMSPTNGVAWDDKADAPKIHSQPGINYVQTKAANVFLAREYQIRHVGDGVISNAWNPGNLRSELQRHMPWYQTIWFQAMLHPVRYGAYTELFAGWGDEAGQKDKGGAYIGPWGRFVMLRSDVDESPNQKRFWEWCEKEIEPYLS